MGIDWTKIISGYWWQLLLFVLAALVYIFRKRIAKFFTEFNFKFIYKKELVLKKEKHESLVMDEREEP